MQAVPTVTKLPADSVPYGCDIARTGKWVYAAYDGDRLVCVAATAGEARRKYRKALADYHDPRQKHPLLDGPQN